MSVEAPPAAGPSTVPGPFSVGPFDVINPIGKGAMGEVWLAEHRSQWVQVAIKFLHGAEARDPASLELFAKEVRAVAGLAHPGIVMVLDHGVVEPDGEAVRSGRFVPGTPYLVMELVRGTSLHSYVGRIAWPAAQQVLLQVLDALAHSHARGVIHCDIKPGNVLLRRELSFDVDAPGYRGPVDALLTDFGLAQAVALAELSDDVVAGTPSYMAPEQLRGALRDLGPWTDLYALGCLAWAVLTGSPPFGRDADYAAIRAAHLEAEPPAFLPLVPVPEGLEAWLRRLLAKRPADRFTRAADAAAGLVNLGMDLQDSWRDLLARRGGAAEIEATDASTWRRAVPPSFSFRALHAFDVEALSTRSACPPWSPPRGSEVVGLLQLPSAPTALSASGLTRGPSRGDQIAPLPASWQAPRPPAASVQLLGVGLNLYLMRAVPFVGRREERNVLWAALRRVHQRRTAEAVLLRGPAGCGKTSLARWIAERAHEVGGAIVLQATELDREGGGEGLSAMLSRHLRCGGLQREGLTRRLHGLLPQYNLFSVDDHHAVVELLEPPVDGRSGAVRTIRFGDAEERLVLIRRLLQAFAEGPEGPRPVILVLDQVQSSPDSLALALHLLRDDVAAPVLVLLAATEEQLNEREEELALVAALCARPRARVIELGPLPTDDHAELVQRLLGIEGELAARVARRTAGNPYFAVQLIGDWVERGLLEVGREGFRLREGVRVDIPADVHAAWKERTDRLLDPLDKGCVLALEVAAVLGNEVDLAEWQAASALVGASPAIGLVESLSRQRLVQLYPDGSGWRFTQPMLRESLERRAREERRLPKLHQLVARSLQEPGGVTAGRSERIGRHLLLAGLPMPAFGHLLQAAEERIAAGEVGAAERLLESRERAMRRLRLPTEDELWAQGWISRCRLARLKPDLAQALHHGERALTLSRHHGWRRLLAAALRELIPLTLELGEPEEAESLVTELTLLAAEPEDAGLLAFCHLYGGQVAVELGRPREAEDRFHRALATHVAAGERIHAATSLAALGRIAAVAGRFDEASAHLDAAMRLHHEVGDRLGVAEDLVLIGELARLRFDLDVAERCIRDAERRFTELGRRGGVLARVNLALVHFQRGVHDQSRELLQEALEEAVRLNSRRWQGTVHALLLPCCAVDQDWAAWDEHFDAGAELLEEARQAEPDIARTARLAGDLARAAEEPSRARQAYTLAWHQWAALERPAEASAIQARLASLPEADRPE